MDELQAYLKKIPVADCIGIEILPYSGEEVVLTAPLEKNRNDKGTAFAGSLASLATLACWSMTHLTLKDAGITAYTAVRSSNIEYLKPVTCDISARCLAPGAEEKKRFRDEFTQAGKARWELKCVIMDGDDIAVEFTGIFVSWK